MKYLVYLKEIFDMSKSNIFVNVEAIKSEKLVLNEEYEFSQAIELAKGLNRVEVIYPFNKEVEFSVQLRIQIHEKKTGKPILRTYPRNLFGEKADHYVNMSNATDAVLTYYIKKIAEAEDLPEFLFAPTFQVSDFTTMNDLVDEVIVINLESRKDKKQKMKAQLDNLDIEHTFFKAVDGRKESVYKEWFRHIKHRKYSPTETKLNRPELYYCGAWGYNETYIQVLEYAIEQGLNSIALFDDDVYFHKDFNSLIHKYSSTEEYKNAELVYLGCRLQDVDRSTLPNLITEYSNKVLGSYGVILKSSVFQTVLDCLKSRNHVVDGKPLNQIVEAKNALILREPLVLPEYAGSDIRSDRDSIEMYKSQSVNTENYHFDVIPRNRYRIEYLESQPAKENSKYSAVLGVKCKDRFSYVKDFVDSFNETRSSDVHFKVYVADTSTNEQVASKIRNYIENLKRPNTEVVYLRFHDASVTDLSNGILSEVYKWDKSSIPTIFMADEDLTFLKKGWDTKYIEAMMKTPYRHIVFYDARWRKPTSNVKKTVGGVRLVAKASAKSAQGAFFVLSSELLTKVGIYNNTLFPTKGGGHLNYTYRLYKALGLDTELIFDIENSESYLALQPRDSYISTGKSLSLFHQKRVNSDEVREAFEDNIVCEETNFDLYTPYKD